MQLTKQRASDYLRPAVVKAQCSVVTILTTWFMHVVRPYDVKNKFTSKSSPKVIRIVLDDRRQILDMANSNSELATAPEREIEQNVLKDARHEDLV